MHRFERNEQRTRGHRDRHHLFAGLIAGTIVFGAGFLGVDSGRFSDAEAGGFLVSASANFDSSVAREFAAERSSNHSEQRVRLALPGNARVIIGSLDKMAGRHSVGLSWHLNSDIRAADVEDRSTTIDVTQIPRTNQRFPFFSIPDELPIAAPVDSFVKGDQPAPVRERVFRLPRFCGRASRQLSVSDHAASCEPIESSPEVCVYTNGPVTRDTRDAARNIIALCTEHVLPLTRAELGSVRDVDHDGRLSVVLCDLADDRVHSAPPIQGCVRSGDFLEPATDLSADVVFLDHELPGSPELLAVLAHECAHAAAFSCTDESRSNRRVSAWLNEAVAHTIESILVPDSENLAGRTEQFLDAPHRYPLFIPECGGAITGRGPERAAGMFFGRFVRSSGVSLTQLLTEPGSDTDRIESAFNTEFEDVFRKWTLSLLQEHECGEISLNVRSLNTSCDDETVLRGTAALWIRADEPGILELSASNACRLQVTIMYVGKHGTGASTQWHSVCVPVGRRHQPRPLALERLYRFRPAFDLTKVSSWTPARSARNELSARRLINAHSL